jgi:type VI secretion system secreted protein VgrG
MGNYQQANRLLSVSSPLGPDVLLLTAFTGREELSRPFSYQLDPLSEKDDIAAADLIGKEVAWTVQPGGGSPRFFHGVVTRFSAGGRTIQKLRSYPVEVVPWLWFLTQTSDCRIFQNRSVQDILQQIFTEMGFSNYEFSLRSPLAKLDYCVRYRETDFHFISRLLESSGIFFYFRHKNDKHTLVLSDQRAAYKDCAEKEIDFVPAASSARQITCWEHQYSFRPGKWSQSDYNFETPATNLLTGTSTVVNLHGNDKFEMYDYPGRYLKKPDGDSATQLRMEEEETAYDVVTGAGTCPSFTPGGEFTLKWHESPSERGKSYVLTGVRHAAEDKSYTAGSGAELLYSNTFTCIPDSVTFRPARVTPRPVVRGPQTAVVVGKEGEELYVDKYGRVKVQFFWDRQGKKDETSSCWVRVAEGCAGKSWGTLFLPRVGQEVVVDFLDGDPDRPIVTGRVYNAEQPPPYELPKHQTRSTVKSRSSKGGAATNFNELRFEDRKGSEQVFLHAERDMDRRVKNDSREFVGRDSHLVVKGSRAESVGKDQQTQVKGERREKIDKDLSQHVAGKRQDKVGGNYALDAGQEIHLKAGASLVLEAGAEITVKAGGNFIHIGPEGVAITGQIVLINSGGSAGSGSGCSPQSPTEPDVADDGTKGGKLN